MNNVISCLASVMRAPLQRSLRANIIIIMDFGRLIYPYNIHGTSHAHMRCARTIHISIEVHYVHVFLINVQGMKQASFGQPSLLKVIIRLY